MHGEKIGIGVTPAVALSYLAVGAVLVGCAKMSVAPVPKAVHGKVEEALGGGPAPAFTGAAE